MRNCFYGYSQNTTGPLYCTNIVHCRYFQKYITVQKYLLIVDIGNLNFCVSDGQTNTEEQWIQEIHVLDRIWNLHLTHFLLLNFSPVAQIPRYSESNVLHTRAEYFSRRAIGKTIFAKYKSYSRTKLKWYLQNIKAILAQNWNNICKI